MVLSDADIKIAIEKREIIIEPLDVSAIQPASVDLRLGSELRVFDNHKFSVIDPMRSMPDLTRMVEIDELNPFVLHPGEFALGVTLEYIVVPDDVVARLDGKSSLGRLGLVVHSTAGFVDPGWNGRLTLELSNLANLPIYLYSGMKVSQISFMQLSSPSKRPYGSKGLGSKYQGQQGPVPSHYHENYYQGKNKKIANSQRSSDTDLRAWLKSSKFKGSIVLFSDALGCKPKTVESWIYGRSVPSRKHWPQLYRITGLNDFASIDFAF
ncbi:MAG: dCTP deaminase [Chloroflexi bacterium]|nr:dCTP deaminase [Chloroflexota bacterium]|tara:strand:+ start:5893 stop:6693 length:801 start_codon:yes stop_codon:yes gene_type:complete